MATDRQPDRRSFLIAAALASVGDLAALRAAVERELALDGCPILGAVVVAGSRDGTLVHEAIGSARLTPVRAAMRPDSVFDTASLTKVVATATACAVCADRGLIDPDAPLTRYLPDHKGRGAGLITLRHLASHTSGFAESPRVGQRLAGDALFAGMLAESPAWAVNARYEYACRNMILLSTVAERATSRPFGEFVSREVFDPLGMTDSAFNAVEPSARVVATHHPRLGESHNPDTLAAGRPVGNAGLFSTDTDLARFCRMMLKGGECGGRRGLSESVIADFTRTNQLPAFRPHGFVWLTGADEPHRPAGLSRRAYGHGGYTGHALWIDPVRGLFVVVLTNRTHPKDPARRAKDAQYRGLGRIGRLALDHAG